jgi:hypothetical protein
MENEKQYEIYDSRLASRNRAVEKGNKMHYISIQCAHEI